jgi:hypothetical protein
MRTASLLLALLLVALPAASAMCADSEPARAQALREGSQDMMRAIERSLGAISGRRGRDGVPASPYRRMDAGDTAGEGCA